ncbi:hypothetical protein SLEP1_g60059 [Rubroshorea leprosula]|uniref:Uncharacterized protein n=1 Tax=Rubroshorea leprosula TaxID=152421 RepID=A0AAV5MVR1_9ROSI|nr:hypothetical protein SLEP1_g60059 [Rubroshorea leprosula]
MADTRTITVEINTKEIIKPSSPTPPHLRVLTLSYFDQFAPDLYLSLVLFYTKIRDTRETSQRLKSSLSQVLTDFYPFSGGKQREHLC